MKKFVSALLAVLMLLSLVPMSVFAANDYEINSSSSTDDYYNLISKTDWEIAPGITESQIVINNDDGSQQQVLFVMEADTNNEYVKVINSYTGMKPEYGNYQVSGMTNQAAIAEEMGYGNVVGAMNTTLSWYTGYSADRVSEPLGFIMLDAEILFDPANCGYDYGKVGFPSVLVINKDYDENGNPRPDDIPKIEMPQITSADDLDGWEDQVIPCSSGYILKDGVNQSSPSHTGGAPRSVVGIKPDGTVVIMANDGRQAPYSEGMSMYELAEVMLDLGCTWAVNCDGGGSTTWVSQRPGEELKINNSPSDGAERSTTTGILFISTAPADGTFSRANITTEGTYYTPGSSVNFDVLGTDLVGTPTDVPDDITWQIKEEGMGSIENGVFTSNGTTGTVTAQVVYDDKVVGEHSIEIVVPTEFSFSQKVMTVPFDSEVTIGLKATINNGLNDVILGDNDVEFTTTNSALGTFNGLTFASVSTENAPENVTSVLTATLKCAGLTATANLNLGKASEVIFDFEDASDVDGWNIADVNGNDSGFYQNVSHATTDGEVHNGTGSMRVELNPISGSGISAGGYAQSDLYLDDAVIIKNAQSIGFWLYVPDEFVHLWLRVHYYYDSNGDGIYDTKNTVSPLNQPEVYNNYDENGWHYYSVDVSAYDSILIPGINDKDLMKYNTSKNEPNNLRFIEFNFPHTQTNSLWLDYGTINGPYTIYIDNITADFSEAADDREAPIFGAINLIGDNDTLTELVKHTVTETTNNSLSVSAKVSENTTKTNATGLNAASAKVYIDGVEVESSYNNGTISISGITVADGVHRVKFEICDNMGNKTVKVRLINVNSGEDLSTVKLVPADDALDRLYGGSLYWMNLEATDIETIKSVKAVIDLNSVNHWELDHMEVAEGFSSSYEIDEENNTATITITRTGINSLTGEAVIASLPVRVVYYDTDINVPGYTAETFWTTYNFWPQDVKLDVDMGIITFVDETTSTFSNEYFSVATEMYTSSANMDSTYKAEHGTTHVHTEVAVADKEASCSENGYTGRTYCNVCDSVVDWGETISAAGHNYTLVDGVLACEHCGENNAFTGPYKDGDAYRYFVNGKVQTGWQMIDNEWYYYDTTTKAAKAGTYRVGAVSYTFEEDGRLTSGEWGKTLEGTRYYYGPSYYYRGWYTIDGVEYYFSHGYRLEGYDCIKASGTVTKWYDFGEDGSQHILLDGIYPIEDGYRYFEDGVATEKGLIEYEGNYYYTTYEGVLATNKTLRTAQTNCDLPNGTYTFDAEGKMIGSSADGEIVVIDDVIYYYENGVGVEKGLVEVDGDYYYSTYKGVVAVDKTINVSLINCDFAKGKYTFGSDGKMLGASADGEIVEIDGVLYYYENGVGVEKGLVECDGDHYYAAYKGQLVVDRVLNTPFTSCDMPVGRYEFGTDGKMVQGIIDKDGVLYYYENGVGVEKGLFEYEGDYYYAAYKGQLVVNKSLNTPFTSCDMPVGRYEFGADGKMINGIIERDGIYYYYENGVGVEKGLFEYEGNYYYAAYKGQLVANKVLNTPFTSCDMPVGRYEFGSDGKMLDGIVEKDGVLYYYEKGVGVEKGLIEYDGDYYYAAYLGKIAVSKTVSVSLVNCDLGKGKYEFGADGKMLNGIVNKDDVLYYYENGQGLEKGLFEYEGNYYYAAYKGQLVVGKTVNAAVTSCDLPLGKYEFDTDGKMLDGIVDKDGVLYYYENGQGVEKGLIYVDGYYYYAAYKGQLVVNKSLTVTNTNGLLISDLYKFDELGRIVG